MTADYLILDIETRGGRPEDALKHHRENWWPDERWTPETIGKRFREAIEEGKTRLGLLDSAGIACVQLGGGEKGGVVAHSLYPHEGRVPTEDDVVRLASPRAQSPMWQIGFGGEVELLLWLRAFLDAETGDETTLVGWNIKGFDLRRLRFAYLRAGLNVPRALRLSADVCDLMEQWSKHWSVSREPFVKLEVALEAFGLPNHKREFDGSKIDGAIAAGKYEQVLSYAWKDLAQETELFLRMTGRSGALK